MLDLMTEVVFNERQGHIRGRTIEAKPRYDIMLEDGKIVPDLPREAFQVTHV